MNPAHQTFRILTVTAGLCVAWVLLVRVLPRPELAETNYEANRLRIERWLLDPPASHVIVGTSIAGRLVPAYFQGTSLANIANLGLDGANPATGLELALTRPTPPKVVFLEVHRLTTPPGTNDHQLLDYALGFGLRMTRYLPLTRAEYRPSSVLYGWLKARQAGGGTSSPSTAEPNDAAPVESQVDGDWVERIEPLVQALRTKGAQVVLVRMPVGRENPTTAEAPNFGDEAAARLGLPLIDLYRLTTKAGERITYTDGLHLTPGSAAVTAQCLVRAAGDVAPPK